MHKPDIHVVLAVRGENGLKMNSCKGPRRSSKRMKRLFCQWTNGGSVHRVRFLKTSSNCVGWAESPHSSCDRRSEGRPGLQEHLSSRFCCRAISQTFSEWPGPGKCASIRNKWGSLLLLSQQEEWQWNNAGHSQFTPVQDNQVDSQLIFCRGATISEWFWTELPKMRFALYVSAFW